MQEQSQIQETGVNDGPNAGPRGQIPPRLPDTVGGHLVVKDDGRRVEMVVLAAGIGDLPEICRNQGLKYLDATRFNHGTGSAGKEQIQVPVYVKVKTKQEAGLVSDGGPAGMPVIEVDSWYWRVKASRPSDPNEVV